MVLVQGKSLRLPLITQDGSFHDHYLSAVGLKNNFTMPARRNVNRLYCRKLIRQGSAGRKIYGCPLEGDGLEQQAWLDMPIV